jgi:transketolase
VILIGTGREVSLCIEALEQLESEGASARVSVEAGSTIGWDC